jgi:multimeric flavodoxin WrbA
MERKYSLPMEILTKTIMKRIAIVQSSLREASNTSIVCREFEERAKAAGLEVEYIDLRDIEMEFCDGRELSKYSDDLQDAFKRLEDAEAIIFGMPVYNYSMSGVLKNFIDICGGAMAQNSVGVIINA